MSFYLYIICTVHSLFTINSIQVSVEASWCSFRFFADELSDCWLSDRSSSRDRTPLGTRATRTDTVARSTRTWARPAGAGPRHWRTRGRGIERRRRARTRRSFRVRTCGRVRVRFELLAPEFPVSVRPRRAQAAALCPAYSWRAELADLPSARLARQSCTPTCSRPARRHSSRSDANRRRAPLGPWAPCGWREPPTERFVGIERPSSARPKCQSGRCWIVWRAPLVRDLWTRWAVSSRDGCCANRASCWRSCLMCCDWPPHTSSNRPLVCCGKRCSGRQLTLAGWRRSDGCGRSNRDASTRACAEAWEVATPNARRWSSLAGACWPAPERIRPCDCRESARCERSLPRAARPSRAEHSFRPVSLLLFYSSSSSFCQS